MSSVSKTRLPISPGQCRAALAAASTQREQFNPPVCNPVLITTGLEDFTVLDGLDFLVVSVKLLRIVKEDGPASDST